MNDYADGARAKKDKYVPLSKRPNSKAGRRVQRDKASGPAPPMDAKALPPGAPAPSPWPHAMCGIDPCDICEHRTLIRLGLRHGSPDLDKYERGDLA